ncbi:MAG: hypothetical protein RR923_02985 [Bacilli bacterium]
MAVSQPKNCVIDGSNIFTVDFMGNILECIGVIKEEFLNMKQTAELATNQAEKFFNEKESYFKKLVENGLEEIPKTQEQINAELIKKIDEQTKLNEQLANSIFLLNKKLEEGYKNEHNKSNENGTIVGSESRKNSRSNDASK